MKITRAQAIFLCELIDWNDAVKWDHATMTERINLCGSIFSRKDIMAKVPGNQLTFVGDVDYVLQKGEPIEVKPFKVEPIVTVHAATIEEILRAVARETIRRSCEKLHVDRLTRKEGKELRKQSLVINAEMDQMIDELQKALLSELDRQAQ